MANGGKDDVIRGQLREANVYHLCPRYFCAILYYKIQSVGVSVCLCMSVRNRLPNHAYYSDAAFTGDSIGLG